MRERNTNSLEIDRKIRFVRIQLCVLGYQRNAIITQKMTEIRVVQIVTDTSWISAEFLHAIRW